MLGQGGVREVIELDVCHHARYMVASDVVGKGGKARSLVGIGSTFGEVGLVLRPTCSTPDVRLPICFSFDRVTRINIQLAGMQNKADLWSQRHCLHAGRPLWTVAK